MDNKIVSLDIGIGKYCDLDYAIFYSYVELEELITEIILEFNKFDKLRELYLNKIVTNTLSEFPTSLVYLSINNSLIDKIIFKNNINLITLILGDDVNINDLTEIKFLENLEILEINSILYQDIPQSIAKLQKLKLIDINFDNEKNNITYQDNNNLIILRHNNFDFCNCDNIENLILEYTGGTLDNLPNYIQNLTILLNINIEVFDVKLNNLPITLHNIKVYSRYYNECLCLENVNQKIRLPIDCKYEYLIV